MSAPTLLRTAVLLGSLLPACGQADEVGVSGLAALCQSAPADPSLAVLNKLLPPVGEVLLPIEGSTLDGRRIDNDTLHGRTVLLNLWFVH